MKNNSTNLKKKNKNKNLPIAIVLIIAVGILAAFYFYTRKPKNEATTATATELSKIVDKNYDTKYPSTPREVARDYSEMLMYLDNKEYSTEDMEKIVMTARKIMDDELLDANPLKSHIANVQKDVASFKKKNSNIVNYTLPETNDVKYFIFEDKECAGVEVSFFIKKKDGTFSKTFMELMFRKDAKGRWKMYGYKKKES